MSSALKAGVKPSAPPPTGKPGSGTQLPTWLDSQKPGGSDTVVRWMDKRETGSLRKVTASFSAVSRSAVPAPAENPAPAPEAPQPAAVAAPAKIEAAPDCYPGEGSPIRRTRATGCRIAGAHFPKAGNACSAQTAGSSVEPPADRTRDPGCRTGSRPRKMRRGHLFLRPNGCKKRSGAPSRKFLRSPRNKPADCIREPFHRSAHRRNSFRRGSGTGLRRQPCPAFRPGRNGLRQIPQREAPPVEEPPPATSAKPGAWVPLTPAPAAPAPAEKPEKTAKKPARKKARKLTDIEAEALIREARVYLETDLQKATEAYQQVIDDPSSAEVVVGRSHNLLGTGSGFSANVESPWRCLQPRRPASRRIPCVCGKPCAGCSAAPPKIPVPRAA